ncbi:MAG: HNH endonuclease [Desulfobaccales bacterium]
MDLNPDDRPEALGPCPLCGRPMLKGDSVDRHHWQPKSLGGKESEYLHRTCHRKLHSLFTDKELATEFASPEQVRRHPEMQKFINWVRRQPPERVVRHFKPRSRI